MKFRVYYYDEQGYEVDAHIGASEFGADVLGHFTTFDQAAAYVDWRAAQPHADNQHTYYIAEIN